MALRNTVYEQESLIKLTLDGRLADPWVVELCKEWGETALHLGSKKPAQFGAFFFCIRKTSATATATGLERYLPSEGLR
jgi:hypothetical protein